MKKITWAEMDRQDADRIKEHKEYEEKYYRLCKKEGIDDCNMMSFERYYAEFGYEDLI